MQKKATSIAEYFPAKSSDQAQQSVRLGRHFSIKFVWVWRHDMWEILLFLCREGSIRLTPYNKGSFRMFQVALATLYYISGLLSNYCVLLYRHEFVDDVISVISLPFTYFSKLFLYFVIVEPYWGLFMHLLPFPTKGFSLFLPSKLKTPAMIARFTWQDGAVSFPVSPVPYTVAFKYSIKPIFVRLSQPNTACHKLETVTSAHFTLYYIIRTVFELANSLPPPVISPQKYLFNRCKKFTSGWRPSFKNAVA